MSIFSSIFKSDNNASDKKSTVMPVLPSEIYKAAVLELQDIIAPSALQITPKALNLGDKIARTFFVISYPRFSKRKSPKFKVRFLFVNQRVL
ncbi:hypothetical protein K8Q96_00190 [Candidatus Nomurabacteria bacterium]|nr:hypothetical protein [Candidatus Nomurabacteria bacterium]